MDGKVMSKKEAVETYGTEAQKNHFNKYGRFINKRTEGALLKTLKQIYREVELTKVGRSSMYVLKGRFDEIKEREDLRSNAHLMTDFTQSLDLFIVSSLEHRGGSIGGRDKTMSDWMVDFGLSNEKLNKAFRSLKNGSYQDQIKELKESDVIKDGQEMVFFDYMRFHQSLKESLDKSILRMEKAKIVELVDHHYAYVDRYEIKDFFDPSFGTIKSEAVRIESNECISITPNVYVELRNVERSLKLKHKIKNESYGHKRTNEEKDSYNEYSKERDQAFYDIFKKNNTYGYMAPNERLVVKFMFVKKEIILKAMPNRIIRYLEKYQHNNPDLDKVKEIYMSINPTDSHIAAFGKFSKERRSHLDQRARKAEESLAKWIEERSNGFYSIDDEGEKIDYKEKLMNCDQNGKYNELKIQRMYAPTIINMDDNYRKDDEKLVLASLLIH